MMFVGIIFIPFLIVFVCFRIFAVYNRDSDKNGKNVAFLHPYCYGGGGGEVVLWTEIAHMLENRIKLQINKIIIYTATIEDNKPATLSFVLKKVESRFEITIDENNLEYLELVPLYHHRYIEPKYHKFAAIFTQSLVTIILALEGLYRYTPQIFVDTTGLSFTYPIAKLLFGCKVLSYTHYPAISDDMISRVKNNTLFYNNPEYIAKNPLLTTFKLYYYKLFALIYGLTGYFSDITMVNSSWTYYHINKIWFLNDNKNRTFIVYPPCNTEYFLNREKDKEKEKQAKTKKLKQILSVGQFRREKNHKLQIESFSKFLKLSKNKHNDCKLILVGGVRNEEDKARVEEYKKLIDSENLTENVIIHVNLSFSKLIELFESCFVGLHCMRDEHFGICLIEYMMNNMVVLGHCSGGPYTDIIANNRQNSSIDGVTQLTSERGFLCTTSDEYANKMKEIFDKFDNGNGWKEMRNNAKNYAVTNFTCQQFKQQFTQCFEKLL